MKMFYGLIYIFTFILSATTFADGWRKSLTYNMEPLNGVYFVSESTGFCVGGNTNPTLSLIYKTTDSGFSWKEIYRNTKAKSLSRVYFVNNNVGFAGGTAAQMLKTNDAGSTWTSVTLADTNDVNAMYFSDEKTGWVLTNSGILRTTDSGKSWTKVLALSAATTYDMTFWGQNHGVITGKTIGDFYYTNDGITWAKAAAPVLNNPYSQSYVRGVYAVDDNNIYAGGWGSLAVGNPTLLLKSTDGGATWKHLSQDPSRSTYDYVFGLFFKDKNNGVTVGGGAKGSLILRTTDGGTTWNQLEPPCGGKLTSVYGSGNSLWVTNADGFVIFSKDFGDTWQMQDAIPGNNLTKIHFASENVAYSVGFDGLLLKTTDSGKSWKAKYVRANKCSPTIQDMYFLDEKIGYTAHSYKMVSKTTDGGDTWTAIIPDTNDANSTTYGVCFITESLGFAVGKSTNKVDVIFKTTDAGKSWDTKSGIFKANLRDVAFFDADNGIVVGEGLKAGYTTDGGKTWTASIFNNVPSTSASANLRNISFISAKTAIAVGDKIVLKTLDGGVSWNYISVNGVTEILTGLKFINASKGWAVGNRSGTPSKNSIYQTTDSGNIWINVADTLVIDNSTTVYDITVDSKENLWVSADNGKIFTTSPLVNVEDRKNPMLASFELNQNYPNPFNPNTTIDYNLSSQGNVKLSIYDALGRLVIVLVNAEQSAGKHKVSLNASELSSGLYFYSLNVGGKQQIKKMSLIK